MVVQAGQDVLIEIDINGTEEYQVMAGLRASKISFNAQSINATNMGSPQNWRELLEGAGIRTATISGSGVFVDEATDKRIQQLFFSNIFPKLRMRIPDFGDIIGKFQITSYELAGNYDGEATYALSFASAGLLSFQEHIVVVV